MATEVQEVKLGPRQGLRPPPVQTKFQDHRVLADLESKAIKAGMMYTEIQTRKGIVFKGKRSISDDVIDPAQATLKMERKLTDQVS